VVLRPLLELTIPERLQYVLDKSLASFGDKLSIQHRSMMQQEG
jgi:hypothetical protein